jgi:hypothetical protein
MLILSSCEKFLDVKPTNQADSKSSVGTAADAQVMMAGIMSRMVSSSYYGRNMFLYADAKGGDLCVGARARGFDDLYVFDHSALSSNYAGFWNQIYNILAQINNLIIGIDKITDAGNGSAALNHIKAQALTVRAICYYDLVRLYGKPYDMDKTSFGVPLETTVLDASAQPTRATVEEVYKQITDDLTAALPLFDAAKKDNGFINYFAAVAVQARVYLQMQNYDAALTAAGAIITSGKYTLYDNTNWLTSWSKQFQSESIFELAIYPTDGNDLGKTSLGSMTIRSTTYSAYTAWDYFIASDGFLSLLGEDPADVRLGLMAADEKSGTPVRKGCCYKYLGGTAAPGDGKATATAVNIKVIRLSEIYLIAAEAALLKSTPDKTAAATYLQAIRKRSPSLAPATAANITLGMIQNERSKELFDEGQRFFDMMRWNKSITFNDVWAGSPVTSRPATIDRTFDKARLPISQDELNANPALKPQQNPGYN